VGVEGGSKEAAGQIRKSTASSAYSVLDPRNGVLDKLDVVAAAYPRVRGNESACIGTFAAMHRGESDSAGHIGL